jgi:hypothetical protein
MTGEQADAGFVALPIQPPESLPGGIRTRSQVEVSASYATGRFLVLDRPVANKKIGEKM